MPLYEVGIILQSSLEEPEREAFIAELRQLLAAQHATIVNEDVWGKRTLAYEIDLQREGYYLFWRYEGPGTAPAPFETKLRLSDQVIRFLHLNLDRETKRARKMEKVRAAEKIAKQQARERKALAAAAPVEEA